MDTEQPTTCELYVVLETPLGGIVACSVDGCTRKVTRHVMRRTGPGLVRLERPLYVCDEDRTEVARLIRRVGG